MRDRHFERRFDELGVATDYRESVKLDSISGSIQSRVSTAGEIPEEVRRHETNAQNIGTSQYPPFVLTKNGRDGWLLLDGHQRYAGFKRAGVEVHDAYIVVSEDSQTHKLVAQAMNADHGLPPNEDERIIRAKEMVREGATQSDAAKTWRVSSHALSSAIRADRVDSTAIGEGMSARLLGKIATTTKVYAHKIKRAPLLRATLEVIGRCGLKGDQAKAVVDRVLSARSDEDALSYLSDHEQSVASTSRDTSSRGPAYSVTLSVSRLVSSLRKHPAQDIPKDKVGRVRQACEDVTELISEYVDSLP